MFTMTMEDISCLLCYTLLSVSTPGFEGLQYKNGFVMSHRTVLNAQVIVCITFTLSFNQN